MESGTEAQVRNVFSYDYWSTVDSDRCSFLVV